MRRKLYNILWPVYRNQVRGLQARSFATLRDIRSVSLRRAARYEKR